MHNNFSFPFDDLDVAGLLSAEGQASLKSRLAFVQVGLWEVRRRWLTGETGDLDQLLANLDEDVEALRQALSEEPEEQLV